EDILNTEHRPKLEELETQLFFVLKTFKVSDDSTELVEDHVSLVLGMAMFSPSRKRAGSSKPCRGGWTRARGASAAPGPTTWPTP
ncbi:MAG: hypothetical protein ACOC15_00880, partial [Desulfovibrionales bacterium]